MPYCRETGAVAPSLAIVRPFSVSLLALAVSASLTPAYAADTSLAPSADAEMVVNASSAGAADVGQEQQDYSVKTTRAGTRMLLTPRDVPQSVSVTTQQRMQDQQLDTIGDVLNNTTGVSQYIIDSERVSYFSRGFYINNYTFDDIPTSVSDEWNFGDAAGDTATFERIEVVRGATGLMTGAGNPGASVNMVRRRADSKTFTGALSASYGSWNRQRYVADLSGPLNEAGSVRGRVVTGYQDQDSWLDRYHKSKKFLYAVVDADVGDSTTLSLGYDYSDSSTASPTWGGLPTWYSDGSRTRYDRSTNSAADWTHYYLESRKLLASASHDFSNGWALRVNGTHSETTFDSRLLYSSGFPDITSGEGMSGYGSLDKGKRRLDSVDSFASGPFELLGRQHQLLTGVSYSRQSNVYYSASNAEDVAAFGDGWDGNVAEPAWGDWSVTSDDVIRQKSAYTAARFSLADPLALILGARYTQYSANGTTAAMRKNNLTPYGGLVYDLNESWSAYASYTSIFQPQTSRTAGSNYLAPATGKNYETGLKSAWLDGRLTATLSVFRIEQDNLAQADGDKTVGDSSEQAYYAAKGVVSKGAEFELNGALTDNLQMTFGAARYVAKDASGARPNAFAPQTTFKLFSSYNLPMLSQLTVGGGVYWQDRTYQDATGPSGDTQRVFQGSYPLANLFARFQVTKQLGVQANVDNLFDREYYAYTSDYAVYGEPRNVSVSLSYKF
ncbi:ferric-rhodotorulic acid/ferric-coprogen receptor FhuE [Erwinia sp. Leaf53]|uniref:ferric-rhodotorulic acid/ferric-coprogen receptor FhuE n=1 Tax=Erwinia sp. Leaf53 TaxID=1736225 RepID=UPI0006F6E218|nr:ferric-rhodotorulic acid/ferric-coprogen receptor FhuE [Erwinia sp. Leaf53]KQN55562.1 ferric-rhodotorulic acid transporter [Erwinia sp. Leaf53]